MPRGEDLEVDFRAYDASRGDPTRTHLEFVGVYCMVYIHLYIGAQTRCCACVLLLHMVTSGLCSVSGFVSYVQWSCDRACVASEAGGSRDCREIGFKVRQNTVELRGLVLAVVR